MDEMMRVRAESRKIENERQGRLDTEYRRWRASSKGNPDIADSSTGYSRALVSTFMLKFHVGAVGFSRWIHSVRFSHH